MPGVEHDRPSNSPDRDRSEHRDVQPDPPHTSDAVGAEVGTDGDLVCDREHNREVRVEVDRVPRLPPELAPGDSNGRRSHDEQEPEANVRHQHVGIVRDEVTRLTEQREMGTLGVADGREHRVAEEQHRRREAVPPMPHCEPIEPDVPLQPREPGHQQQLEQHGIGAGERGQLPGRGRHTSRAAHRLRPAVTDP